jgi:hypothetical protein
MNVVIVTIQNANEIFVQFSWQINAFFEQTTKI